MRCRQCGLNSCCGSDLEQQLQQAEARVANYKRRSQDLGEALVSHIDWESDQPQMKAWLLRKQADAVEELIELYQEKVGNGTYIWKGYAVDQAQRLRQQAYELEK